MAVKFDFSGARLSPDALSKMPMTFCNLEGKHALSSVLDLVLVETCDPTSRQAWQRRQLTNLCEFASERSAFWRKRIGARRAKDVDLSSLPVLGRDLVNEQVLAEGALLRQTDSIKAKKHGTSGSTGVPVEFFVSEMNAHYPQLRMLAQYLMEGRDLSLNRTRVRLGTYEEAKAAKIDPKKGFAVERDADWLGPLGKLFAGGKNKSITYWHPDRSALLEELSKQQIGYLVALPSLLDSLFTGEDAKFLKDNGTALFIPLGESPSQELVDKLRRENIPVRASYSCEEVGLMASECALSPGHYHAAHSNVIIEADKTNATRVGDVVLTPVLVTGLHAYATPFIRYDVGDLALVDDACPCGHEGTTLSNILGRKKNLIKHADGRLTAINLRASDVSKIVAAREHRVRQVSLDRIVVELGGCGEVTNDQIDKVGALISAHAGGDFAVDVKVLDEIAWGKNQKRLGFVNEVI